MSRVLTNIRLGEKQLKTPDKMTTLDQAASTGTAHPAL
jgi:hypothetical protein